MAIPPKKLIDIKTGKSLKISRRGGLERQLGKLSVTPGTKYLKSPERKVFSEIVKKHASALPVGKELPYLAAKKAKRELWYSYKKGKMSRTDYKTFKRIIESRM